MGGVRAAHAAMRAQVLGGWLREAAVACRRHRDELLSAVLELLLAAPPSLLPPQVLLLLRWSWFKRRTSVMRVEQLCVRLGTHACMCTKLRHI